MAIFKTFFPEDFVTESSDKTMTLEEATCLSCRGQPRCFCKPRKWPCVCVSLLEACKSRLEKPVPDRRICKQCKYFARCAAEVMEERQGIKSLANGEPVLQAQEPLLLEHYHCDSPVVATRSHVGCWLFLHVLP